jgi:hypothetical protein
VFRGIPAASAAHSFTCATVRDSRAAVKKKNSPLARGAAVGRNQKQILLPQGGIRMTCHPDPALREKDLLFLVPR